jgi:two-component system NarL family sensor kinase
VGPRRMRDLTAVAVVGTLLVVAAFGSMWLRGRPLDVQYGLYLFHNGPPAVLLFWLGRLVLLRQPGNRIGWVLLAIAALGTLHVLVASWADVAMVAWGYADAITWDHPLVPADMPLSASVPLWVMNWLWVPQPVLLLVVLPLVFPDGHLPGPRWRPALWLAGTGGALVMAATMVDGWPTSTWLVAEPPAVVTALFVAGGPVLLLATVVAFAGMAAHWRAADPHRRHPFHVVGATAGVFALAALATYPWQRVWIPTVLVATHVMLAAYALAAARYRLHDLEPVLGRAAVATGVSLLVAAAYLVAVVLAGIALARRAGDSAAPLVAVGAAALLAEPVRRGTRQVVVRLLLRVAHDRTVVVSRLAERAAAATSTADTLTEVVQLLVRSTGAQRAEAWLDRDGQLDLAAVDGADPAPPTVLVEPVLNRDERLGELRLFHREAADLAPDAPDLLADVAHVLGSALHNHRLTARLRAQLDELRTSRRRLVDAQDTARRGLERDLHDGAQAQLVALRLRVGALQVQADPGLRAELDTLAGEIDATVTTLRDLARGLHPPVLDQDGIVAALNAHVRYLPTPVTVTGAGLGRYDPAVESTVYFCCLEAVQNAVRHGRARTVTVELSADEGLEFAVRDDGSGFDTARSSDGSGLGNIADRVAALDGELTVRSSPGQGTVVTGRIPARPG